MPTTPGIQRLFVAAYPPPDVALQFLDLLLPLDLPPHSITAADQLHLTLQFIGDTAHRRLADVTESVERSAAGLRQFLLTPVSLRTLPQNGPPRLIAIETDAPPTLIEIHRRLVHRLARNPRNESVDAFLPHLTLARFTPGTHCPAIDTPINLPPFPIRELRLVRSRLRPAGAIHETIAAIPLSP